MMPSRRSSRPCKKTTKLSNHPEQSESLNKNLLGMVFYRMSVNVVKQSVDGRIPPQSVLKFCTKVLNAS